MVKPRLMVSVSGGRTSGYMAKKLKDEYSDRYNMIFVFANTGEEWEATLQFVDRMDREWGLGVVWLEAVVHHGEAVGCTHRVVDYVSASRNGEPFEEMIKKYGIPNKMYPHCTRELKLNVMESYLRSLGGKWIRAVGIRSDEPKRVRPDACSRGILYPLCELFLTNKPMINDWWDEQPFQLPLREHQGNCKWCWKKSTPKLVRIAKETPEVFDFPARMEERYGLFEDGSPRHFFRENRSAKDILAMSEILEPTPLQGEFFSDDFSGCSESCEAY